MDLTVLYNLSYGLYVVGAFEGKRPVGGVINTCFQVTSEDPKVVISLNKTNHTLEVIRQSGKFSLAILSEDTNPALIGKFGFFSSRDTDKYADFGADTVAGTPVVKGKFAGTLVAEALNFVDCGTHVLVVGRLIDTVKGEGTPMTYAYYHKVVKGKAPKSAPTYRPEDDAPAAEAPVAKRRFVCDVCGYVETVEGDLPADYRCPICKVPRSHFKELE